MIRSDARISLAGLQARVRLLEGGEGPTRATLPFGLPAIDARLPGEGRSLSVVPGAGGLGVGAGALRASGHDG